MSQFEGVFNMVIVENVTSVIKFNIKRVKRSMLASVAAQERGAVPCKKVQK